MLSYHISLILSFISRKKTIENDQKTIEIAIVLFVILMLLLYVF